MLLEHPIFHEIKEKLCSMNVFLTEGPASKRLKTDNQNGDSNKNLKKKSLAVKPLKCDVCKQVSEQNLNEFKFYSR